MGMGITPRICEATMKLQGVGCDQGVVVESGAVLDRHNLFFRGDPSDCHLLLPTA